MEITLSGRRSLPGLTNEAPIFILFLYSMLRSAGYRWRIFLTTTDFTAFPAGFSQALRS
jgi:hypothetical protein